MSKELEDAAQAVVIAIYHEGRRARIHELRAEGHAILSEPCRMHDHNTAQIRYRIENESQLSLL